MSEMTEAVVPLRRTDPAQVGLQVRQEIHRGGVSSIVVDLEDGIMVVERTKEAQAKLDLESQEQNLLGDVLDPMDVVMRETLNELRVEGLTIREAMFEAVQAATESGGGVAFWSCGRLSSLVKAGGFRAPVLKSSPLLILGAPVLESDHLSELMLVACVAPVAGALPIEVEHGLLIRLEDLRDAQTPEPPRRSPPENRPNPSIRDRADGAGRAPGHGGGGPPVWFG